MSQPEILLGLQGGVPTTTLVLDCEIPVEAQALPILLVLDHAIPIEAGLIVSKAPATEDAVFDSTVFDEDVFLADTPNIDLEIPVESGMQLVRSASIPVESIATVPSRDESIPIDSSIAVASIVRDDDIPIDATGNLVASEQIPIEALLTVDGTPHCVSGSVFDSAIFDPLVFDAVGICDEEDRTIPIESGMVLVRNEEIPVESIDLLIRDESIPVEQRFVALVRNEEIPVESAGLLIRDENIPVEQLVALVRNEEIPVEPLLIVDGTPHCVSVPTVFDPSVFDPAVFDAAGVCNEEDRTIPIESGMLLVRNEEIPVESGTAQGAVVRDESIPVESGTILARTEDIPVESGDLLTRDDEIPVESGLLLARTEDVPVEFGGLLARDEDIPVEQFPVFITLTRDEEIPIEALAALVRDEDIPVENTGVVLTTLVRDEDIPIESISQALPFSFITFLGGAGAPWPPSWLTRPKLLADERHCGSIRFYGRSRQVIRRPLAPLPMVIGKPRRRKPVHKPAIVQATLVTRQLSEGLSFVGGKSTQKIGHDWKMIREADEREIMTIIQVL